MSLYYCVKCILVLRQTVTQGHTIVQVNENHIIVSQIHGSWQAYREGVTADSTGGGQKAIRAITTFGSGLSTIPL